MRDARSSARALVPPLLAFLAARTLVFFAALTANFAPLEASTFRRWDSDQYLSIASRGYYLVECARTGYLPYGWCGNTGWMPAYPALLEIISTVMRTSPVAAGVLLSAAFEVAALGIAWRLLEERNFFVLLACALVPGMVYHHAIFPISMCAFFILLTLSLLVRDEWIAAGSTGAVAAATYSSGFLLGPVVALYSVRAPGSAVGRLQRALLAAGLVVAGLAAVFGLHWVTVGAWDAFLRVQAKYGHGIRLPTVTWVEAVSPLWSGEGARAPALQALFVGVGIVALVVWRRAGRRDAQDALFLGSAGLFWIVPLILGGVNLYRADSLLVPGLLVLRHAPAWVNAAICVGLAMLGFFMAQLFFQGVLI